MKALRYIVTALVVVCAGSAAGQQKPRPFEFDSLKTFRCDFTESEGRRVSAKGETTPAKRETFSDLVIDNVDYARNTARFIGNAGSESVNVINGRMTASFIETSLVGNVNMLSIFKETGSLDRYKAAYSRHSALTTGDLTISQSYGTCRGLM